MPYQSIKNDLELGEGWKSAECKVPQQQNGVDCGVWCAQFMKYAYFGHANSIPDWTTGDIAKLREMMAFEIYEGSIRWYDI